MPITPFHFGPGAVIHALAPSKVSFLAFCAANVAMDVEPLYYMITQQYPLHRFLHTYVGAALVAIFVVVLFLAARRFAARFWLPNLFEWRALSPCPVVVGAAAGSCSHIVLNSLTHRDIGPLAPFSEANPLLGAVSLDALHLFCLASGVVAHLLLAVRRLLRAV